MENKSLISFDTVMRFAETNPSQKIWCISMDGRIDFLMDAGEIKKTVGNFNWDGVDFFMVSEPDERADSVTKIEDKSAIQEARFIAKKVIHKVKMFSGNERMIVEKDVNNFLEKINGGVDIEHSISQNGSTTIYSVLIHYLIEE